MDNKLERSFGLLIAFVIPGFLCLIAASQFSPVLAGWMSLAQDKEPTLGGFLYVGIGAVGSGMVVSAVRWLLVDSLHHATGIRSPRLDFSRLDDRIEAFQLAVEHYYRYYQFHSNTAIAAGFYAIVDQVSQGLWGLGMQAVFLALEGVLLVTSRDNLRRYYERTSHILGDEA